jgi:hypothetical protein
MPVTRKPLDYDSGEGVLFIRNIPITLRDAFKAYCYKRGKSMRKMILKMIREVIADENRLALTRKKPIMIPRYLRDKEKREKKNENP